MEQFNKLSNREWEVAKLLLQGKSNKLIALSLGISNRTVEFHLKNIYAKFQVSSRIELILKLGNATGMFETEKLGRSTVADIRKSIENSDRLNSWMGWAIPFRDTVSIISKELEMKNFLNLNNLLVLTASLLLLFVNWLAFHDFGESHTVRDWLMLIASALIFLKFVKELWNQYFGKVQG
jgi:DNA-binding CsgD family transcriptional regulator